MVSIIVPSFNQGRFIGQTIDSILSQDYRPIEILVMDAASSDETANVLRSYRGNAELKVCSEPDSGVVEAVNKGLSKSSGEILSIQSSDDIYLPGAIRSAVEFLIENSDCAMVYGDVEYIDEHSVVTGTETLQPFDLKSYLGRFTYIPQPSTFVRANAARQVGGWRSEVSYAADADYWIRIALRNKVTKLDKVFAQYRYHSTQRDQQKQKICEDWEKVIVEIIRSHVLDTSAARYAQMGIYLAKYKYTPEHNWKKRTEYLYSALLANPTAVFNKNFPKRELLIGREPVWKFLSRVKRGLGFRPRGVKN